MEKILSLGWANGWAEEPAIVKSCREQKHTPDEFNLDPSGHGYDTLVRCTLCGYEYHYDSSD